MSDADDRAAEVKASTDRELIEATLGGDNDRFGLLVRRYQSAVFALALGRVPMAHAAEEIAQDVFVSAYQGLHQLKDPEALGAWLRSITVRQCGMWLRSERRNRIQSGLRVEQCRDEVAGPNPEVQDREGQFGIESLIQELPEGLRAAAVLCLEDDLSPQIAAEVLDIKPGTLRKRLHDARARLQRSIVERAERELRLHLLPKDFETRCVCRCAMAERAPRGIGGETMKRAKGKVTNGAEVRKQECCCGCRVEATRGRKQRGKSTEEENKEEQ